MNEKTNAISVIDSTIKAKTSFNKKFEVFKWEWNFEQYEVEFSSWLTYDNLIFSKDDYILEIRYSKKETYEKYSEYLPDTVRLNGKHFPDFVNECRKYNSEPTAKIMDIFKGSNLSAEELEIELKNAIRNEDYEKAALLRDKIRSLKS